MNSLWVVIAATAFVLLLASLYIVAVSRHKKASTGKLNLMGALARVETRLEPEGSILVRGEMWLARSRSGETVEPGQTVRVVGASSHLLEVEPVG